MAVEYGRLRAAAEDLWIAPKVPLRSHLYTHAGDLQSKRIFAKLRHAAETWPEGHEPQAYLLLYATGVSRRELQVGSGEPVFIASDIVKPAAKHVDRGPYLAIVAIGYHAQARGYAAVRAYAQPVLDGRHFVPIDSNAERAMLALLLKMQWSARERGVLFRIKKPVFDIETDLGPCRPDFMLEVADQRTRTRRRLNIEVMGYSDASYAEAKLITIPRMERIAPVHQVELHELDDEASLTARLSDELFAIR